MKKVITSALTYLFLNITFAQQTDMDNDGISDMEDVCPNLAGTKANRGCPEVEKPNPKLAENKTFIEAADFRRILQDIYNDAIRLNKNAKPVYNKSYTTDYKKTGTNKNFAVNYIPKDANSYNILIPLSNNPSDLEAVAASLNKLFAAEECCLYKYGNVKLRYSEKNNTYDDVLALDDFGVFFNVAVVTVKQQQRVQLKLTRYAYAKKAAPKVTPPVKSGSSICSDIKTILASGENKFKGFIGSFIKKEIPNEYYATTLPKLGCTDTYILNTTEMDYDVVEDAMEKKVYKSYSTEQKFSDKNAAEEKYNYLKAKLKECCSGLSEEQNNTNQKVFVMQINQGSVKIIATVVYVNLMGQIVGLSFKVAD